MTGCFPDSIGFPQADIVAATASASGAPSTRRRVIGWRIYAARDFLR
jgi:hypothetical protein